VWDRIGDFIRRTVELRCAT
jgi:hypothetical protein